MFEAVFILNFKATGFENQGILQLYDYRIMIPELKDKFHIYGNEFKIAGSEQHA